MKDKKDMLFSERYGYKKIDESLVWEKLPKKMRNRLWNRINSIILNSIKENIIYLEKDKDMPWGLDGFSAEEENFKIFLFKLWDSFYKRDSDELVDISYSGIPSYYTEESKYIDLKKNIDIIKKWFFDAEWFEVFDFVEFLFEYYLGREKINELIPSINKVLTDERSAYRIVDGIVTPLIDEEEIKEIEKALKQPDKFEPVRHHLKKSLEKLSERKNPDYANSIKESISAVGSLVQIIQCEKGTLGKLIKNLNIHPALKKGFSNLYGWTSDEGGIRHPIYGNQLEPELAEARYMLVTVSAFTNYVISKYSENEKGE